MDGNLYLDTVGEIDRCWPPSYNGCIDHPCPRCHAPAYDVCVNPISGRAAKAPCMARNSSN